MSRLRPFQISIKQQVFDHWHAGKRNVLVKSPTGSGKTVVLADVVKTVDRASAVIAHRGELVSQISKALAHEGVRHRIIGPDSLRKKCVTLHMEHFKRSFFDAGARVGVCSIDTLTGKDAKSDPWFSQVGLWVQDEAHHVQRENKWGRGVSMFPNAYGLGVTALALRADGGGLGAGENNDGMFHALVRGPELRHLIDTGYLTDYRVFTPPSDVDYSAVTVTDSGDYSPAKLRAAVHASDKIVGDVVRSYKRICFEKLGRLGLGVTFAVDVESAKEIAAAYNAAGVPAEVVTAKTEDVLRDRILQRFARREIMQLVNVDLFGEGFDLPAIEVVSMVRKTESRQLYIQQFGRSLRLMVSDELGKMWDTFSDEQRLELIAKSGKPYALIIDHVGNVFRHGLPDAVFHDSLERRASRASANDDAIPTRVCTNPDRGDGAACAKTYERYYKACPFCHFEPVPAERSKPEHVDGDVFELSPEVLAALRGGVMNTQAAPHFPRHLSGIALAGANARFVEKAIAQHKLRDTMAVWAGWKRHQGMDDRQAMRAFFLTFDVDILSAASMGGPDAEALAARIQAKLDQHGVIAA